MGYRVEYDDPTKRRRKGGQAPSRGSLTALCFLLFLLLVNLLWPQGKQALRDALIPGNAAVTVSALEELAADLKTGEELDAALEAFCRRVLHESEPTP